MKPEQIYQQLEERSEGILKRFRTDLTNHDKKAIFDRPELHFIWMARETGTMLFQFFPVEDWPDDEEPVKYLFSTATRTEIIDMELDLLKNQVNEHKLILMYTGRKIVQVSEKSAVLYYQRYCDRIKRIWNNKNSKVA